MQVNKRGLRDIFTSTITYVVPLFQRPYVWERDQNWEPFWESIESVADSILNGRSRQHFLGAVVLEQISTATGEMPQRQIIDGQQRFTTLQIFLSAFHSVCESMPQAEGYTNELDRYIWNTGLRTGRRDSDRFKVWPTNSDRAVFQQVLAGSDAATSRMGEAKIYFTSTIRQWLADNEASGFTLERCLEALFAAIDERLFVAVLDLEKDDDSLEIFETLNALGTPLLASDLIKNYSLRAAQKLNLDIDQLYHSYFEEFETHKVYWSKDISVGRFKRKKIDVFYQYYLGLKLCDDVIHEDLFRRFKEYLGLVIEGDDSPEEKAQKLQAEFREIKAYADLYERLENLPHGDPSRRFLDLLEGLETTTFMPVILLAHGTCPDRSRIHAIESSIASFLMRRMIVRATSKSYNRLVIDLLSRLIKAPEGIGEIPALLLAETSESTRWPEDHEVAKAFMDAPLYIQLKRNRLRITLERIDEQLNDPRAASVTITGDLQIEHLLPQAWKGYWPLPAESNPVTAEPIRNTLLHTIGNLTLLTGKLNESISNGAWDMKRPEILKHNSINLNREFQDDNFATWDENKIKLRSERLAKLFCRAFPRG